ncbi:myb-like protein D [Panonychus citri]|uniref:myb-like protein D n=1 Tax=Panonychus citri TaxID=50023 RepID=UPI0023075E16|nr:myb-like protein D [Panonychus citri]
MELIYRSSLIVILIETILHCVSGDITKIGLTEPTETTLIEMKPLYHYSFDDNDQGSRKLNRLLKKNRKKDPYGKRRDSFRLFTSDDDKQKESTKESESGSQQEAGVSGQGSSATGGGKVVNIDKGLLESHKEQELDHLDHDSHSNEDKFVKMIWDKGDGFVKRWHWDRGEKIKEKHSIAEKKHLEHHDKGKIDEHIEKQKGVVVHSKAEDLTETNGIDNMAKSTMTSDKETKNDDIVQQLRLLKQRQQEKGESENIDQQLNGQSNNYQELNGNDNNNNNEENVNDSANNSPNNRVVSMLLGGQSEDSENGENNNGNGLGNNDENNQENINNLRRKQYREILQRAS